MDLRIIAHLFYAPILGVTDIQRLNCSKSTHRVSRCTILCTLHHMLHLSCTLGSLTRPAFVFFRSSNAAPMYLLSNNRSCTGVLLGLALARRTLYPNPFLLSHGVSSAGQIYGVPDQVRWQASLPHLSRRATERRSEDTSR